MFVKLPQIPPLIRDKSVFVPSGLILMQSTTLLT